jgi:hypothetical protein
MSIDYNVDDDIVGEPEPRIAITIMVPRLYRRWCIDKAESNRCTPSRFPMDDTWFKCSLVVSGEFWNMNMFLADLLAAGVNVEAY